jgi:hypothetical protein
MPTDPDLDAMIEELARRTSAAQARARVPAQPEGHAAPRCRPARSLAAHRAGTGRSEAAQG